MLRRPLAPLGNGTTRKCARLLMVPFGIRRRPLSPTWTEVRRTLEVVEAKIEVGAKSEDKEGIERII